MAREPRGVIKDLIWGCAWGAVLGVAYAGVGVGIVVLTWPAAIKSSWSQVPLIGLAYLGSGVLAGAVVGLLRPWVRTSLGAGIVGFLSAIPAVTLALLTSNKFAAWSGAETFSVLVTSIILGVPGGLACRRSFSTSTE